MQSASYVSAANALDFPTHLEWLNTGGRKYTIKEFHGKIVLLDFWTYCCINCMHVIPDLKRLEEKYPELIVVGVHSAKFRNEKDKENIREAILRYEIKHPVIVDNEFELWRAYGINSWPSFMLISPEGKVVGRSSGEGVFDKLDPVIGELSRDFGQRGVLNKERFQFDLIGSDAQSNPLYYPGKIEVDAATGRLFISDSNHNRIVVAKSDGTVLDLIGSGIEGQADSGFAAATFNRPQGLAYDSKRDALFIADTENHLIRRADFGAKTVKTILGTGKQARTYERGGMGTSIALNSPWDLVIIGDTLYIAMAGPHQLWQMDMNTAEAKVFAGSGHENIIDGIAATAALAQPSGITTDGKTIYFADSEVSAIRKVEGNRVSTLIGKGLFEFGDIDGGFDQARLQHPLGVLYHEGALYVADTYNHKVKQIDLEKRTIRTIIGTGKKGYADGLPLEAQLNEPNDIAFLDCRFYIADTNNHAIRIYHPDTNLVSTLTLKDLTAPGQVAASDQTVKKFEGERITLEQRSIRPDLKELVLKLNLPEDYKWNLDAPNSIITVSTDEKLLAPSTPTKVKTPAEIVIPITIKGAGEASLIITANLYYCRDTSAEVCLYKDIQFELPLKVAPTGETRPVIEYKVIP